MHVLKALVVGAFTIAAALAPSAGLTAELVAALPSPADVPSPGEAASTSKPAPAEDVQVCTLVIAESVSQCAWFLASTADRPCASEVMQRISTVPSFIVSNAWLANCVRTGAPPPGPSPFARRPRMPWAAGLPGGLT